MGDLLRKMLRINYDQRTIKEIEAVAEGAAQMQEQHARDVISMAEEANVGRADVRVKRAESVVEQLR
jgi:7-cyano-7-deazaguanine synthase in queuosine biosynthesis